MTGKRPITWRENLEICIVVLIAYGGMGAIIFAIAGPPGARVPFATAVAVGALGVAWALTVIGLYLFAPRKARVRDDQAST